MGIFILLLVVAIIGVTLAILIKKLDNQVDQQSDYITFTIKGTARGAYGYIVSDSMLESSRDKVNSKRSRF